MTLQSLALPNTGAAAGIARTAFSAIPGCACHLIMVDRKVEES